MLLTRPRWLLTLLLGSGIFLVASRAQALTESEIRLLAQRAFEFEKQANWEKAREIYEALLSQRDHGLKIRERYQQSVRRCWQVRRHQDPSYRKEVLSVEYGQALRIYSIITNTLLDASIDKKNLDATKLFRKGLEELDSALGDPLFQQHHLPDARPGDVQNFRALLKKTWGTIASMSRKDAAKQIGEIAMAAEVHLKLDATVVAMEFACGACYAIDDFTVYLTPNQLRELTRSLARSEAVGVGLTLTIMDNKIVVYQIAPESPATRVNPLIGPNDQILSVDKKAVVDLPLHRVKEMLEGPAGSMVDLEIVSAMDMNIRVVRLQRQPPVATVNYFPLLNTPYGYLKITGFSETTVPAVDEALANLARANMKGLIIDLRFNNGGVFESAIETARKFLSTGIITSTAHQDPSFNFVYHAKNTEAVSIPLVVLVDGETASAAEVLAGALKDNHRAVLIGQTTYGKGCTQRVLKLPNALGGVPTGGMKLTVARFFSPKGVPYSGRGVVPHILIDEQMAQSHFMQTGDNLYLSRAIDELNRQLMMPK